MNEKNCFSLNVTLYENSTLYLEGVMVAPE